MSVFRNDEAVTLNVIERSERVIEKRGKEVR